MKKLFMLTNSYLIAICLLKKSHSQANNNSFSYLYNMYNYYIMLLAAVM